MLSQVLEIQVQGVQPALSALLRLEVMEYVGGGPTKHVYRVCVLNEKAATIGLTPGQSYCLKIYRPASGFAARFRNPIANIGSHGAGRAAALWQKLLRRAARTTLGWESCVADVYATFYDRRLHWYGTIEEWIGGRYWKLEIEDRLFDRERPPAQPDYTNPTFFDSEYTAKRFFQARLVRLLRDLGAHGLARRYDWRTWRSQRKILKRSGTDADPYAGLTAIDFRYTPGNTAQLKSYVNARDADFQDLARLVDELAALERPAEGALHLPAPATVMIPQAVKDVWRLSSQLRHRPRTNGRTLWKKIDRALLFPFRLLFRSELRRKWMLDLVAEGLENGMLTQAEAERIRGQIEDPYIRVYLKCLAVHLCMLPTTPVVVTLGGLWYSLVHDLSLAHSMQLVAGGLAFFAVSPVSPGSLARGLFVVLVVLRRREFRRFRVALLLSFWRYVGYLAFPLQMVRTFPALARFMAARWAIQAVHAVPVLGRRGNLLEHRVFDLFFNFPLTVGRALRERRERRR